MGQKVQVLIVDDSAFFRKRIREALARSAEIDIVGEAANGREAVELAARLKPDLITMDVAMPQMDGITAVREIMRAAPTDILMISSLTRDGARATLDALDAGAVDFLPKQGCLGEEGSGAVQTLGHRVVEIARRRHGRHEMAMAQPVRPSRPPPGSSPIVHDWGGRGRHSVPKLLAIGASTGGPVAIQQVLSALPASLPFPVVVAVHMPAEFTATFAERLNSLCQIDVVLAADGQALRPGQAVVAPGGTQMLVENRGGRPFIAIRPGGSQLYKPSVDILFGSAARALGASVHAVILTGMGADGTEGARMLKEKGATVWSQDQASSVVYGMPFAVAKAGYSDRVLALPEIGNALAQLV